VRTLHRKELADYLRNKINGKGWSYRDVAGRSGGLISHSAVADIINEKYSEISTTTIKGLAVAFNVEETEIISIASGNLVKADPEHQGNRLAMIGLRFNNLPADRQPQAVPIIDILEREIERLENE
jgi:transcriptional regulator with XRE-family HTH domain